MSSDLERQWKFKGIRGVQGLLSGRLDLIKRAIGPRICSKASVDMDSNEDMDVGASPPPNT